MSDSPVVTLTNGVRVANFSSPHPFTFTDGTVLPACSAERAQASKLEAIETETPHPTCSGVVDLQLDWKITSYIVRELHKLDRNENVDIVLVPFPVMTALKNAGMPLGKARVIRNADRVKKEIHIDKFCA
jgi:hypothetical protein